MFTTAGTTDRSIFFNAVEDVGGTNAGEPKTGLTFSNIESASYVRAGAARVAITPATLASASAAHSDGGFVEIDATNTPGLYRFDPPDAAFVTGVDEVVIYAEVAGASNAIIRPRAVQITDFDLRTSNVTLAAAVHTGATVPTVTTLTNKTGFSLAATGLDAIVSTAIGMVEIAIAIWDRILTGATHNDPTSAGKRLRTIDAAFEVHSGTAQAGTSTTITLDTGASAVNNIYDGDRCVIVAGTGVDEHGLIKGYVGSTKVATMSKAWVITPDNTSEFILSPADVDVELWNDNTVTGDGDWSAVQDDLDTITGTDGVIIAPAQGPIVFTGVSDESGIEIIGNGSGSGFKVTGGATGHGFEAIGGATSGDGINATADGGGKGMNLIGVGASAGLRAEGGAGAAGIHAHGGTDVGVPGVEFHAHSADGDALELSVDGTGDPEANLAAILTDTANMQPKLGSPVGADMSADIADIPTVSEFEARTLTAADIAKLSASVGTIVSGVVETGTLSSTQMTTDVSEVTNDHWIGRIILWTSGPLTNQATNITDSVGANGLLTFVEVTDVPVNGNTFIIV